jgi:DnaJ-class molecular chaperone
MKEYYELFGLTDSATDEEITVRYQELKAKYNEDKWLDGEAGTDAARMLTKLETAYQEIMASRKEQNKNTEGKNAFEEISDLLRNDKVAEAQDRLDAFNERTAEWHYLQAVVYYKKNWTNDSKKQLEIAMQMDPDNVKYRSAYGKMNAKNNYEQQQANQQQNPYTNGAPMHDDQMGGNACSDCISCCYTYLCVDCLFSLCCGCR